MKKFNLYIKKVLFTFVFLMVMIETKEIYADDGTKVVLNVSSGQDITMELQDAVNQYTDIVIPQGEYTCNGIKIGNVKDLVINATDAVIKLKTDAANPILYTPNGYTPENVTINGGIWDGNGNSNPVFRFYGNVNDLSLNSLNVQNSSDIGIRVKGCTGDLNLKYVVSKNNNLSGILVSDCNDSLKVYMDHCNFDNNGEFGIRIKDTQCALAINRSYAYTNGKSGILASNCKNSVTIYKFKAKSNSENGISIQDSSDVILNAVTAAKNKSFGVRLENVQKNNNSNGIYMKNSEISSNKSTGIYLRSCPDVRIKTSNIEANLGVGINIYDCNLVSLYQDKFLSNSDYGINIDESGTVTSNQVESCKNKKCGLRAIGSNLVKISFGKYDENGAHGIYIDHSIAKVNQSQANSNYWGGLVGTGETTKTYVNGGQYNGNGTRPDEREDDDSISAGVSAYCGASLSLTEVTTNQNHGSGINAAGENDGSLISRIAVYGCVSKNNGDHGITSHPYGKINIKKSGNGKRNLVSGNKYTAVLICGHSSSDYITDCDVIENKDIGLSISENSKVKLVSDCTFKNNASSGIHVQSVSSVNIQRCETSNNSGYGLYCGKKSVIAVLNLVSDSNNKDGIRVTGNGAKAKKIDGCTITNNDVNGIEITSKGKVEKITNTTIQSNKKHGLAIYAASTLSRYTNSTSSDNGAYQIYVQKGAITSLKKIK